MKISGEKERGKEKRGGDDHPCLVPHVEIYGERRDDHPHLVPRVKILRKKKGEETMIQTWFHAWKFLDRDDHPRVEIYGERGDNHPRLVPCVKI